MTRRFFAAAAAFLMAGLMLAPSAEAQQVRIRGKIDKVDGRVLSVTTREGRAIVLHLAEGFVAAAVVKASLADIKPSTYIGTAAMPQPDGSLKALEVLIFPEAQRGVGEGTREFDLEPGSTMTNATVSGTVSGANGQTLTVTFSGVQKIVQVPPGVPVVTTALASAADVKPGIGIVVFGAEPQADGSFLAKRITIGKDGIDPPM